MSTRAEINRVTKLVIDASTSIEARFTDMGERLGTAVDTIGILTRTFDRLGDELDGENLRGATRQLAHIISTVAALANVQDDKQALFGQLTELTSTIQRRILQMGKAVDSIGMLTINTRIEAAHIGEIGLDFAVFTKEIGRTLRLAQTSLGQFTTELGGVGHHLQSAASSQSELARHRADAIRSVPARLEKSINAITERGRRVAGAASAVTQKSRQVGQSISDAVMALQIGDITRQRLEHVEHGLGVITEILAPRGDINQGDWSAQPDSERYALASLCGRLLSAQLLDAADEFDREVRRILSAVQDLATDAENILHLGSSTVGATDDQRSTFIGKVEEQVADVEALLKGAATARREADAVAVSVSDATVRLVGHTSTLRSLEEDIRIMGLNMTLKCGRLGVVGMPLMVIAQELRSYSNQIATEAGNVTIRLDTMVTIAGSLSEGDPTARATSGESVAAAIADAVSRLKAAGESLADALATLAHHTDDVAALLRDTVACATEHEELAQTLRDTASELTRATTHPDGEAEVTSADADRMLTMVMRSYTMERERIVHDREMHGRIATTALMSPPQASHEAAPADYEDVFF